MFGLAFRFDATAWKVRPLKNRGRVRETERESKDHGQRGGLNEKLLEGLNMLNAVIFQSARSPFPVGPRLNFNLQPWPVCIIADEPGPICSDTALPESPKVLTLSSPITT